MGTTAAAAATVVEGGWGATAMTVAAAGTMETAAAATTVAAARAMGTAAATMAAMVVVAATMAAMVVVAVAMVGMVVVAAMIAAAAAPTRPEAAAPHWLEALLQGRTAARQSRQQSQQLCTGIGRMVMSCSAQRGAPKILTRTDSLDLRRRSQSRRLAPSAPSRRPCLAARQQPALCVLAGGARCC